MLDKTIGLKYCGESPQVYQRILNMFATLRPQKQQLMADAMAQGEWEVYISGVHALKTNVRNIGGSVLDEKALALEMAGKKYVDPDTADEEKRQSMDFIQSHHQEAMELYDKLAEEASKLAQELA